MKISVLIFSFLFSLSLYAQKLELKAFASDQNGFPADALCFFSNNQLTPHPQGMLVLYTCLGGSEIYAELWQLKADKPRMIVRSKEGNLLTPPFLLGGKIFVMEFSEFETEKLWEDQSGVVIGHSIPAAYKNAYIHDMASLGNKLWFRYSNKPEGIHGEGFYDGSFHNLPARKVEFFYKPNSNGKELIVKTKTASGDQVEIRKLGQEPVMILKENTATEKTPYQHIRPYFAYNNNQWVGIATMLDKKLGLISIRNGKVTNQNLSSCFKEIDYWPPALNSKGELIVRARHHDGRFGVWKFYQGQCSLLLGKGAEIRIKNEVLRSSSKSLLYNSPVVDENNRVWVGVGLEDPAQHEDIGQGIIRIN
jgi:hypothetical protein